MREVNLLDGNIKKALVKMSVPLMGISFVQITYNLVAMFWLGRYSEDAMAAVGTASLVGYIGNSLALIGRVGTATWVAQSYGKRNYNDTVHYIESGIKLNMILSLLYTVFALLMVDHFLNLFTLTDIVRSYAKQYITIQIIGMFIVFLNPMIAVSYNSIGNSVTPFKVSIIGLVANFILNPILIFFFDLGIRGAALATVIAQGAVLITYIIAMRKSNMIMSQVNPFTRFNRDRLMNILKIGWPASVQSTAMALIAVVLNSFISRFGSMPIAVFALGIQIESIGWMTADGFSIAVASFMGQNLGAENYHRLEDGYKESMKIFVGIGAIAMTILVFFGGKLTSLFRPGDLEAIAEGGRLLAIMGISEILMTVEIGTNGALNGVGLTKFPAVNGLFGNLLRIPISLLLMPKLGVLGIWIAISISMALKGISAILAYQYIKRNTDGFRNLSYRRTK